MKVSRRRKPLIIVGIAVSVALLVLAATSIASRGKSKASQATGSYVIGFSNGFSGNTWRTEMLATVKLEAAKHPEIKKLIILDGQNQIAKQIGDVESLIAQHVNALLIIANSGTALVPVVAKAKKAGIVTVPFNLPLSGNAYDAYVGTDPAKKGATVTKCLVKVLHAKGNVVEIGGIPGNSYSADFFKGVKQVLAGTGIKVLTYRDANWAEDRAKVVMSDLLSAYPTIDGVIADGSQDAAGAVDAFLAAKRPVPAVTGDDFNRLLKLFVHYRKSQPHFHICLQSEPTWESTVALDLALKILEHKPYKKLTILQPKLITDANVSKFVKLNLPDGVFVDTTLPASVLKKLFH
jgi:ribose transport system substrate-binding protein